MRLIDKDLVLKTAKDKEWGLWCEIANIKFAPEVKAIPIEQLLSILPKHDDYIHTKTYPYNVVVESIYSQGYEDGWNACLKAIKEELDYWEKENEMLM